MYLVLIFLVQLILVIVMRIYIHNHKELTKHNLYEPIVVLLLTILIVLDVYLATDTMIGFVYGALVYGFIGIGMYIRNISKLKSFSNIIYLFSVPVIMILLFDYSRYVLPEFPVFTNFVFLIILILVGNLSERIEPFRDIFTFLGLCIGLFLLYYVMDDIDDIPTIQESTAIEYAVEVMEIEVGYVRAEQSMSMRGDESIVYIENLTDGLFLKMIYANNKIVRCEDK